MSRRHPTHSELEQKAMSIEIERRKVSTFRPKITYSHLSNEEMAELKVKDDLWKPGEVERDDRGLIIGENRPLERDVIPFSQIKKASKARHDTRRTCTRENCAFKNSQEEPVLGSVKNIPR